jgi:hypothetical protein
VQFYLKGEVLIACIFFCFILNLLENSITMCDGGCLVNYVSSEEISIYELLYKVRSCVCDTTVNYLLCVYESIRSSKDCDDNKM